MANGVPVVASDVPGTREIVENERTGLLLRPGDAENLAECLDKLIRRPQLTQDMGRHALQYVTEQGLTPEQITESYLELFGRICSETS